MKEICVSNICVFPREREKLERQKTAVLPPRVGPSFSTNRPNAEQSQARLHVLRLQVYSKSQ